MPSTVHLAAVANTIDAYDANFVGDFVNHAVVTYADAPIVLASSQFAAAGWARDCRQRSNRRDDATLGSARQGRSVDGSVLREHQGAQLP